MKTESGHLVTETVMVEVDGDGVEAIKVIEVCFALCRLFCVISGLNRKVSVCGCNAQVDEWVGVLYAFQYVCCAPVCLVLCGFTSSPHLLVVCLIGV
jgi:hypothetical protein